MPPKSGGMDEQDYKYTIETELLDRVFCVVVKWRKGKVKDGADQKLINWLVKEGLMNK